MSIVNINDYAFIQKHDEKITQLLINYLKKEDVIFKIFVGLQNISRHSPTYHFIQTIQPF